MGDRTEASATPISKRFWKRSDQNSASITTDCSSEDCEMESLVADERKKGKFGRAVFRWRGTINKLKLNSALRNKKNVRGDNI